MILNGSQRGGAMDLARHLQNTEENDHVTIHEIRGFLANDLTGALKEVHAISRGTKCQQYMYSLSLNPPEYANVSIKEFEEAINAVEKRLGLNGQARVIVFHEKQGRRHAHCVWSRIDAEEMKAINIHKDRMRLREESRHLFIKHDWQMPKGLINAQEKNPLNFTREEWQQAKRVKRDTKALKAMFQDCWAIYDSLPAFRQALEARGYLLAKGDRRGFVATDYQGEVYSLSRWCGVKSKALKAKLGDPKHLPDLQTQQAKIKKLVAAKIEIFSTEIQSEFSTARLALKEKRKLLVVRQREERAFLHQEQTRRFNSLRIECANRFRKGLRGIWDRLTGKHKQLREQNEHEMDLQHHVHEDELQRLIQQQLRQRRELQRQLKQQDHVFEIEQAEIQGISIEWKQREKERQHIKHCEEMESSYGTPGYKKRRNYLIPKP